MMTKSQFITPIALVTASLLSVTPLTGCQQEGFNQWNEYTDINDVIKGLIDIIRIDDTQNEVPVEEVKDICSGKSKNYVMVDQTRKLLFKEDELSCNWEQDGNLSKLEGFFRARTEQTHLIQLSPGSVLCDLSFSSQANQKMYYDDHFLLTLNGVVFATTYKDFIPMLNTKGINDLPFYRWESLVGQKITVSNTAHKHFCLGEISICQWPMTQKSGTMTVALEDARVEEIMALDITRNNHQLAFITTGDDNESDCKHSDFAFDVRLKFATLNTAK